MDIEGNKYGLIKDFSVSGEAFRLVKNYEFGYLETTPQPKLEALSSYYESEDYISHTNAKRNLFEKAYHVIRNISLKKKLKLINSFASENKNILDIGCGTGDFLKVAQDNNWTISGIEPNDSARAIASDKCKSSIYNTEQLKKFSAKSFDVITLWHVLEHLPDLENQIAQFKRLLKDNGTLVVAVPNYKSYDASYYKNFWAAFDVPRHLWHFSSDSIIKLFGSVGMRLEKKRPMIFDAFYVSLLSEKYKNKTMNPVRAFFVGLKSNCKAMRSGEYSSVIYVLKNSKN